MAYNPEDLDRLEVTLLGVLSVGLPPPSVAGSDTFRVDHVTAVVAGLAEDGNRERYLGEDGVHVTREFGARLKATVEQLIEKKIVAQQEWGMPAAAGTFADDLQLDVVERDQHPAILDRYLSQLCMEELFQDPAVYPVLMERYAASGEVWRRVRDPFA